jgi:hypothetical protein
VCNEAIGRCVPPADICARDADCGAGRACDELFQRCYDPSGDCVRDTDCRPNHTCNRFFGRCEGCGFLPLPFLVCPDNQVCILNLCNPQ